MKRTGMKLTQIIAGAAYPMPTVAKSTAMVAASV